MKYTIYKCFSPDTNDIYIGSTTDLKMRIRTHNQAYNENKSLKLYDTIRINGGFSNWRFESLEESEAEDKTFVRQREQHFINELQPSLNQVRAYRTQEEKRVYGNEQRAKYRAKYHEKIRAWNDKITNWKWRCETCDYDYPYTAKARHLKTKKHNDNVNGVERRPRVDIREDTTGCNETTQTPQKKSFTEQEYFEVLQNPDNYNKFFELCGECRT